MIDENEDDEYVENNKDSEDSEEVEDNEGTGGDQVRRMTDGDNEDGNVENDEGVKDSESVVLSLLLLRTCRGRYSVSTEVHFSDTSFLAVSSLLL